jgi:PAS domain S-box-containing protein
MEMMRESLNILLIEDNPGDARLIEILLSESQNYDFVIENANSLATGIRQLEKSAYAAVILDLGLPDSQGLDTFRRVQAGVSEVPIIVLTGLDDQQVGVDAVNAGAQDFLVKGDLDGRLLVRVIRYSIQRKKLETELREREQKLRVLVDNTIDVIWQMDLRLNFTYVSPSIQAMTGFTPEEWVGTNLSQHTTQIEFFRIARQALRTIKNYKKFKQVSFEAKLLKKDGEEIPVEISGKLLLNENGLPTGLQGINRDITERKQAEQIIQKNQIRYQHIFETAGVSIWVEDFSHLKTAIEKLKLTGVSDFEVYLDTHPEFIEQATRLIKIKDVNQATLNLLEAENKAELLGSLDSIFVPETEMVFRDEIKAIANGQTYFEGETINRTLKGNLINVLVTIVFPVDEHSYDEVLISMMDITNRVAMQAELNELNIALEKRVRQRTSELQVFHELSQEISYTREYEALFEKIFFHLDRIMEFDLAVGLLIEDSAIHIFEWRNRPLSPHIETQIHDQLFTTLRKMTPALSALPEESITHILNSDFKDLTRNPGKGKNPIKTLNSSFQVPLTLLSGNQISGLLYLGVEQVEQFTEDKARLLYTLASQVSITLDRLRSLKDIEQRRLQALVERIPEGLVLLNKEKRVVMTNPAANSHLEELAPASESRILTALGHQAIDHFLRPPADGQPWEIAINSGKHKIFEIDNHPIETGPEAGGWVLTLRDVTWERDLLASEQNLRQQTEQRLKRLSALREIDSAITSSVDLRITMDILLEQTCSQLGVNAAGVLLMNPYLNTLEYISVKGFNNLGVMETDVHLGAGLAGQIGLKRKELLLRNLAEYPSNQEIPSFFYEEGFQSYFGIPLTAKGVVRGVLEIYHRFPLEPDPEWLDFLRTLAGQTAIAIDNAEMFDDLRQSNIELVQAYDATIEGWARALEYRDLETEGHSRRVVELTTKIAVHMGIQPAEIVHVRRGALLHDIGKMGIPDNILQKPDKLTDEEWAIMKTHPLLAFEMLAPIQHLRSALDIPQYHHEKWDGSGYPAKLKGGQIPLGARIFAIVDVWDALRSDRPYRSAWQEEKVITHIRHQSGKHFDPQVVDAFLHILNHN